MDRSLALLGIAKKAGLLAIGSGDSAAAARRGKAVLLITASDASGGAVRRAEANALSCGARYIAVPYTRYELGNITGRGSPATIAFLDKGLADGFTDRLAETGPTDGSAETGFLDKLAKAGSAGTGANRKEGDAL